MRPTHWLRTMPMIAILVAALAASAGGGCGDDDKPDKPNQQTGGTGGGDGGSGGTGGTGGTGGEPVTLCEDDDDCQPFERCDEDEGICVPKCVRDRDCGVNKGLRCDKDQGICVPGEPCDISENCGTDEDFDYCSNRLRDCYCQEDQSMQQQDPPSRGVCWRKAKVCDLCETDEECGDNGLCMAYNYDGETRNVCLRKATAGACPFGMILYDGNDADLRGMCVPQYADCGNFRPCTSDEDCDQLNPVCDTRRGICVRGCSFDYVENKSLNCPPDRVCHMTEWGTNPQLLGDCATGHLWGYGSCGSPCQTHDDCSSYGEGFVCETYGNEARCVPAPAARKLDPEDPESERIGCMSDDECSLDDPNNFSRGYCDLATYTCVEDGCRRGLDWRKGCNADFEDCRDTHKCDVDPETNHPEKGICVEKDCIDKGGAEAGCNLGHFCAGEPYRDMFTGELLDGKEGRESRYVETPAGVGHGQCYPMNENDWCFGCNSHEECDRGVTDAAFPSLCLDMGDAGTLCGYGCDYQQDCPANFRCESVGLRTCADNPFVGFKFCDDDADCGGLGSCVEPVVEGFKWPQDPRLENKLKVCTCDPSRENPCGAPSFECNAGIATMREGQSIVENYCTMAGLCGPNGSCEFFGDLAPLTPDPAGPWAPIFHCANDGDVISGVKVDCPEGSLRGGHRGHRHRCVASQVCVPALIEGQCGVP